MAAHRDVGVAAAGVVGLQEGAVHKAFGNCGKEAQTGRAFSRRRRREGRREEGIYREETMV